jgi:anti-sigma factor RsiW
MTTEYHPSDVVLFALAAGTLDETERVDTATHVRECASCRAFVRAMEHVGGIVLDGLPPTSLADGSVADVMARLDKFAPPSGPAKLDDNSVLLLHAYLDGELDPANALEFSGKMRADPALAAEAKRIEALRRLICERLPRELAPPDLRARIEASLGPKRPRIQPSWGTLAASIALTAMVASSSTWFAVGSQRSNTIADALVSDHIRALMAPQSTDVMSSDRHTVKPWFNGRIPQSPRVVDLANQDFPLVGGRIDVINKLPVPTLVYRRRQHLISLTELPTGSHFELATAPRTIGGYNLVRWTEDNKTYWAVSDLNIAELEKFAQLIRTTASVK